MKRTRMSMCLLAAAGLVGVWADTAVAHEPDVALGAHERRVDATATAPMDPAVRALLVELTASLLREAADSPDPIAALGAALERKLMFALRSPELYRLVDSAAGEAVKDAPAELREPMQLFASAMLERFRREMLERAKPRSTY